MEVVDPGHYYNLRVLDASEIDHPIFGVELCFVKREGEGYPGNVGHHAGTTSQEVLRALIDRSIYVDNQIPDPANAIVLRCLREALWELELRAAKRHGRSFTHYPVLKIETFPTCEKCNHIGCKGTCRDE